MAAGTAWAAGARRGGVGSAAAACLAAAVASPAVAAGGALDCRARKPARGGQAGGRGRGRGSTRPGRGETRRGAATGAAGAAILGALGTSSTLSSPSWPMAVSSLAAGYIEQCARTGSTGNAWAKAATGLLVL